MDNDKVSKLKAVYNLPTEGVEQTTPRIELLDVTPAMALAWLEKNTRNRSLSQITVNKYARLMAAGQWQITHQGIGLGPDGEVFDGQHRLWAVVEAKCTVRMYVAFGVAESARSVIDSGRPQRTADQLRRLGGMKNSTQVSAWVNMEYLLTHGSHGALGYGDVLAWREANQAAIEPLTIIFSRNRVGHQYQTAVTFGFVFAHPVAHVAIEQMANRMVTLEGLTKGDPIHTLVQYATGLGKTEDRKVVAWKTLRAIHATLKGERLASLLTTDAGLVFFAKKRGVELNQAHKPEYERGPRARKTE